MALTMPARRRQTLTSSWPPPPPRRIPRRPPPPPRPTRPRPPPPPRPTRPPPPPRKRPPPPPRRAPARVPRRPPPRPVLLNSGDNHAMPMVGLGTWKTDPGVMGRVIEGALRSGYRHFDCAAIYGNEKEIGEVIAATP